MGKGQSKTSTRQAPGAQSNVFRTHFRRREPTATRNFPNVASRHPNTARWGEHEPSGNYMEEDWVLVSHPDASYVRATTSRDQVEDVVRVGRVPDTSTSSRTTHINFGAGEQDALAISRLALTDDFESRDVVDTGAMSREPTSNSRNSQSDRYLTIPGNFRHDSGEEENVNTAGERSTLGNMTSTSWYPPPEVRGNESKGRPVPDGASSKSRSKGNIQSQDLSRDILRGMRDNLVCPIHLGLLERPKTLPCQHVICEGCIEKWFAMKERLVCPSCNTAHPSPAGGVKNLPDNFVVNNLVQEIEKVECEDGILSDVQVDSVPQMKMESSGQGNLTSAVRDVNVRLSFLEKVSKTYKDVPGAIVELRVQMCDSDGNCIRSDGACSVDGAVHCPYGRKEAISITFREQKGDFAVTFVPKVCGLYIVEAVMSKVHIVGSPMQVVVRPLGTLTNERRGIPGSLKDIVNTDSGLCITGRNGAMYLKLDIPNTEASTGKVICSTVKEPPWSKEGQVSPFGIDTWDNRCYITDTHCNCVHVYSFDKYDCSFNGNNILQRPTGIAVDRNGWIYVANSLTQNIEVFGPNFLHRKSLRIGQRGKNGEQMSHLSQVVLNQTQDGLIVVDQALNCLRFFDLHRCKFIKTVKTKVKQSKATPFGIAVDKYGNIFVSVTVVSPVPDERDGLGEDLGVGKRGAILMYNSNGFFLGRFGERELHDPRCLCLGSDQLSYVIVVDNDVVSSESGERDSETGKCSLKVFKIC